MINRIRVLPGVLAFALLASAQQTGRIASLKSQALTNFERGQFDQVAGKLEEVWEQDQSDPKVAEYLAIGYLYGEHSVEKAKPVMLAAIAHGGQATFLVRHSHEKSLLAGDIINNYCNGRMSINKGSLAFTADSGEHSTSFPPGSLKEMKVLGGSPGRVQIKSAGKTYVFRVKSETSKEASLLEEMTTQSVK